MVELIRRLGRPDRPVLALKRATVVERAEQPGTDSSRFAEAGAAVTGLTWPGGTYVVSPEPGRPTLRLDRPASLNEVLDLARQCLPSGPHRGDPLVLAEGFSDAPYPRIHVLARPGHAERLAGGPVLATWRLEDRVELGGLARLVDVSIPLLGSWAAVPGPEATVACVLAGGCGKRLGGLDKWSLRVAGRIQEERCLEVLTAVFGRTLVVGRPVPSPPSARQAGPSGAPEEGPGRPVEWLPDSVPGLGPLGGLLTALRAAGEASVFAFAGDMPLLSRALILHLLFAARLQAGHFDVLLPVWSPDETGGPVYSEPLHAVYTPACRRPLEDLLSSGGLQARRMTDAFEGLRVLTVPGRDIRLFGDPRLLFLNLNTPADLDRAEAVLGTSGR